MMRFVKPLLIYAMFGLLSAHAGEQSTDSTEWFIGPVGFLGLMEHPNVLLDLNMSEGQRDELQRTRQEVKLFGRHNLPIPKGRLTEEQQTAKGIELNNAAVAGWQEKLTKVLTREQLQRLTELQIQYCGAVSFITPQVQKALHLTETQKIQAKQIVDEMSSILQVRVKDSSRESIQDAYNQAFDKAYAMLTEPQKATWKTLTGKPLLKPWEKPVRIRPAPSPRNIP